MRFLWTLVKVVVVLAIAIPLCLFAFAVTMGVVGIVLRLAILALRVAILGVIGYVGFRVLRRIFGGSARPPAPPIRQLPVVDPYYQAAMRELDSEIGKS